MQVFVLISLMAALIADRVCPPSSFTEIRVKSFNTFPFYKKHAKFSLLKVFMKLNTLQSFYLQSNLKAS